jgi:ribosomal protein L40E
VLRRRPGCRACQAMSPSSAGPCRPGRAAGGATE